MTEPTTPDYPTMPAPPDGPPIAPPPPKPTGRWIAPALLGVVGLCVWSAFMLIVGAAIATPSTKTTTPTVIASETGTTTPSSTVAPTTTTGPHVPVPADFVMGVIETRRACFGSAGCNVNYKISVSYLGAPTTKAYTIVYEIQGAGNTRTDNFTLEGKSLTGKEDGMFSSVPASNDLTATVIRVIG
jgi:hypothetical protein